jgi:hypothetical protein
MKLENTNKLLSCAIEGAEPRAVLLDVLRASIELLSIEDNDFVWSSWKDSAAAVAEVRRLLAIAEAGGTPDRSALSVIFAPTGPMQEVSISSGWGDAFLKVAERYDYAEKGIWGNDSSQV